MKKIFSSSLKSFSKAVSAVVLFLVSVAAGTMSSFGIYEPEMPSALRPKESEEIA